MMQTEYKVNGMTCEHCEMSVREEVEQIPGVEDIQVDAKTGKLLVASSQDIPAEKVLAAVNEAGYTAEKIN